MFIITCKPGEIPKEFRNVIILVKLALGSAFPSDQHPESADKYPERTYIVTFLEGSLICGTN